MLWELGLPEWKAYLQNYDYIAKQLEKRESVRKGLEELEQFMWVSLKVSISERTTPFVSAEEYRRLVSWKLKRGKWRMKLQKYADELDEDSIVTQSKAAFKALSDSNDVKASIKHLCELRGCGPATASAVLASLNPSVPFMSDELLLSIPKFRGVKTYTLPTYMKLYDEVNLKLEELNKDGGSWTARDLERACFSYRTADKLRIKIASIVPSGDGMESKEEKNRSGPSSGIPSSSEDEKANVPLRERNPTTQRKTKIEKLPDPVQKQKKRKRPEEAEDHVAEKSGARRSNRRRK